jgi:hypothetical protein
MSTSASGSTSSPAAIRDFPRRSKPGGAANNEAMRETGVAEYYEELKKMRPRYP